MSRVVRINGALVEAQPLPGVALFEVARVGERGLLGEVIRVEGDKATLQVYEDTTGLRLGDPVQLSGRGLTARLGPGLLGAILDGVGRPLPRVAAIAGDFVRAGAWADTIDVARRFHFRPALAPGANVRSGDILGAVEERPGVDHFILVPPHVRGVVASLPEAERGPADAVGALEDGTPLPLVQEWPVREPRPFARRLLADQPLVTGQRVFDLLFPVAEGGTVAVPGGFGTGKTVIEQSLAKHGDADVVVFVGCGERGNEMAEVVSDFACLRDPRTGRPLLERTVLIVNTSNMPVPAREASIYLGLTVAEYFRDQGKRVAVMADSISRWAEALREMGSRLREMPGEEGYPVYLASRLGKLMERAGRVETLGTPARRGSVTLFCAVSPPGGDFSEPVTQGALRVAGALWALDASLAHQRQFPAVDAATSYSYDSDALLPWFAANVDAQWPRVRLELMRLLDRDRELREIASLVGSEALQDPDRLVLEVARVARESVLGQHAYDENDANSPLQKTFRLAGLVCSLHRAGLEGLKRGGAFERLRLGPALSAIAALPHAPASRLESGAAAASVAVAAAEQPEEAE